MTRWTIVRAITDAIGVDAVRFEPAVVPGFDPAASARVVASGTGVGVVGALAPGAIAASTLASPVVAFELDLGALDRAPRVARQFRPVSPFPPSTIDLAFVVTNDVLAADLLDTLRAAGGDLLESVHCFDEFRGAQLGEGRRSLAFALRFRALDRTLKDTEVAELRAAAIEAVHMAHGAEIRT